MQKMQGTPQRPRPGKPGLNIPIKVNFDVAIEMDELTSIPMRQERQARRMKITWGDVGEVRLH